MQYREIAGIHKPSLRLIQGTLMLKKACQEENFTLLDELLELGCTTFDLAYAYNYGESECVFGEWMRQRQNRDDLVIVGKGAGREGERFCVTPADITRHLHTSLERLQTEYIDLYLLHRDDPAAPPVGPLIDVLNKHQQAGKIRAFGASNWTTRRIEEANRYAQKHGLNGFVASSPQFSLAIQYQNPYPGTLSLRTPETQAEQHWYQQRNWPLLTWSILARGFLAGKITRDNLASLTDPQLQISARCYGYEENFQRLERAKVLAAQKHVTLPQIALAFVFNQPLNIFAIVGCLSDKQFQENLDALTIQFTPDELAWLDLEREELS